MAAAVAPWMLGAGWLVSFTASAGYDVAAGTSAVAALTARAVPPLPSGALLVPPSLGDGLEAGVQAPRSDLKARARVYPLVDRSRKGDPVVMLRATLSRRAGQLPAPGSRVLSGQPDALAGVLAPGPAALAPDLEAEAVFVPWPADESSTTTDTARAESSPAAPATGTTGTGRAAPAFDGKADGTTPSVPRAVALSSTTPAPADATPVEIAAASVALPSAAPRGKAATTAVARVEPEATPLAGRIEDRARYADLITPENLDREQRCLAEAVYFEARSEPEDGQAAVAQVVLNRVKSGLYPTNVCGVVYQNRHRYMGCQFSFACEGKSLRITDNQSWATASRIAKNVIEGRTYLADVGASTHYHADYVRPRWSRRLKRTDVIGRHIFYTLRPGQT
jgi:spore germination cell wall hydrolase CwlJ-like protein